ncbi:MAG: threonine--tRNA ligase [Bacilli bacterium]
MIKLIFPDGNEKEFESGVLVVEVAKSISPSLAKKCVAAYIDDELYDFNRPIEVSGKIKLITQDEEEAFEILNHSTAHLLAHAVKNLYPHAKFGVGPAIENGFYYDIDLGDDVITEDTLVSIEKEMKKVASSGIAMQRLEMSRVNALNYFSNDEYKQELINDLPKDEIITIYKQGEFSDLCRGGHIGFISNIKHFKLLNVSGAYWRGNSENKMLQRIYGTSWYSKEDLENHLHMLEEAKKRDHRKLGKELDLFMLSEYGPGFPFFLPNGMILRDELENYWKIMHKRENYDLIKTPTMLSKELWEVSGHWFNYRENMYLSEIDKYEFAIKPMNCPGSILVYKNGLHSYKSFPWRVGELGLVHRHEASGALHGLFRVRSFTQDDAHIYMTKDQIKSEVVSAIKLFEEIYSQFELDFYIELSTKPEKAIGDDSIWEIAEDALAKACIASGKEYKINEGDGAFYGPKLDFQLRDCIGRVWQCGTIQLDLNLPERFDLTYINANGEKERPVMVHRTCFGSIERFIGILIEHYAGAFPVWLAPRQVDIIPVNNNAHLEYATKVDKILKSHDIRSNIDDREEKLGYKIRESQMKKVCYQLVIGDNEVANNEVTYRKYGSDEQITLTLEEFTKIIVDIRNERK